MPKRAPPPFLILDACVLIDYVDADIAALGTISRRVAPVVVARPVFDEVEQLDEDAAGRNGIRIVDLDLDVAADAVRFGGSLSFQDALCLLLAKRETWTCVTNDKPLRRACTSEGVGVLWGLEMMLRAVRAGAMTVTVAVDVAEKIHSINPRFVTAKLLAAFKKKLDHR